MADSAKTARIGNPVKGGKAMTSINDIQPGSIVRGPTLPEPVEVLATAPMGESLKTSVAGCKPV